MVDAYGFERPADFDYKSYEEFMSRYVHVLARRAGRWAALLDGGSDQLTVSQKCKCRSVAKVLGSLQFNQSINHFFINTWQNAYADTWQYTITIEKSQYESLNSMRVRKCLSVKWPVWLGICLSCGRRRRLYCCVAHHCRSCVAEQLNVWDKNDRKYVRSWLKTSQLNYKVRREKSEPKNNVVDACKTVSVFVVTYWGILWRHLVNITRWTGVKEGTLTQLF